ncbi:MAG TPA: hypothetical protein VIX17_17905 [Pyrinomonadaceae bacterium]
MSTFTYRRRLFLAPVSTGFTSHVLAEVESSCNGEYDNGHYMLTLADCHRSVQFEFFLGNAMFRRQSLAKIDLLLKVLNGFRAALLKEAKLIADYEKASRPRRIAKHKHHSSKTT